MTSRVALTFEAGGSPDVSAAMLDALRDSGTPATIFLDGAWAEANPDLVRRMAAEGHELGNHAYTHPDLTGLDDERVRDELRRTDDLTRRLTGKRAFPWFRPPYAAIDERVRRIAMEEGYRVVQRDAVDGGHWTGETTVESIIARTLDNAADGAVIAYHLNSPLTLVALPQIAARLRERGCTPVILSELPEVGERVERHPDFATLPVEPGYLQGMLRGARLWSMNLIEYGARLHQPAHEPVTLARLDGTALTLLTGEREEHRPARAADSYLLVLAGEVECRFHNADGMALARAVARAGDMLLWPAESELTMLPGPAASPRRWIGILWTPSDNGD